MRDTTFVTVHGPGTNALSNAERIHIVPASLVAKILGPECALSYKDSLYYYTIRSSTSALAWLDHLDLTTLTRRSVNKHRLKSGSPNP